MSSMSSEHGHTMANAYGMPKKKKTHINSTLMELKVFGNKVNAEQNAFSRNQNMRYDRAPDAGQRIPRLSNTSVKEEHKLTDLRDELNNTSTSATRIHGNRAIERQLKHDGVLEKWISRKKMVPELVQAAETQLAKSAHADITNVEHSRSLFAKTSK